MRKFRPLLPLLPRRLKSVPCGFSFDLNALGGSGANCRKLVRAVTITPGDLVFENNFKMTEDEKAGLAFKNDAGEKIAVLDQEGNLHIKGRLIQDLQ